MTNVPQEEVLKGRYRLMAPLGRGGLGTVYEAFDLALERRVAIKIVPSVPAAGAASGSVANEARTLARLHHPNVLAVYDVGEANDSLYVVTELIEGPSLAEILREGKPLDPVYALEIIAQVGQGLAFMHRHGLTHRDIKPANILVEDSGRAVLSDFGLAMPFGNATLTATGTVLGTAKYMSPEQAMGMPLDSRSDIYSLAVVLYEALSGQSWSSDTGSANNILKQVVETSLTPIRELNPTVSGDISRILERALAKNPDARQSSADEFVRELRAAPIGHVGSLGAFSTGSVLDQHLPDGAAVVGGRPGHALGPNGRLLAICAVLAVLVAVLAATTGLFWSRGVATAPWTWRESTLLFIGALGGLLVAGVWLQIQLRARVSGSRFETDRDGVPVVSETVIDQEERQTSFAQFDAQRRVEPDVGVDDLPATAPVAPYSPDTAHRLHEFAAVWNELSRGPNTAIDKARFVAAAKTIVRDSLREAVGYRIERSIPYLKGTVGCMVEAPFLWIRHSRFPILFVGYDGQNADLLATVVQQLEIARATEYFALLVVVPPRGTASGREADELKHLVADSVYRHDFVVLDRAHLARLIAQNSSRALVEIILEQGIDLADLSPYVVSGPVPDNMFFGRESQLKTISQSISRSDFAVVGGRRIGKSSTLLRLARLFGDDPRYRAIYIDCEARLDYQNFLAAVSEHLNVQVDGAPSSFQRMAAAFRDTCSSQLLVFLLDEVDELLQFDADQRPPGSLFRAFRAASHEGVCRFVFSGSRTLYRHLRDARSPFFNFCEAITLGRLHERSTAEIVRKPMQQLGCDIPDGERLVRRLIDLTSSHPNIAQWMCDRLIKTSVGRRITVQALEQLAATPEFQDHYVTTAWSDATPIEKLISLVIEGPVFTDREVRDKLAACNVPLDQRSVRDSLDILCLYSLLDREGSGYRFALSQFPRIVRDSGVAAAQIESLASEVRSRCS